MELGFTQEQEMIRSQAAEFLKNECPKDVVRELMASDHAHSDELWEKMAAMGWMGLIFPEEYGGVGLSFVDQIVVLEEMGRALTPGSYFSTVLLAGLTLLEAASDEQKRRWLAPLAEGRLKATLALAEPDGAWTPEKLAVRAERADGGFRINGVKLFVPDAHVADLILCAAQMDDRGFASGLSLFAVDRRSEGLNVTPLKTMDQTRRLYEVSFEAVKVPAGSLLGAPGQARALLERVLDLAAIGLCAQMVGGAQQVLNMCVEYSKSRIQFGRPIGSFQAIQHRCADMLLLIESARSAVYAAACAASEDVEQIALHASIAKAYTSDAYTWVAGEGIQIHGGMGFTWEHDAHLYFKRAKADEVTFGDAGSHRERVARLIGL
ncbi:MAG TPA: acyl-CoA dehydrogenase family protein [Blastocatellia bacterium]|nr:acyl-CoA dehydrogenase family protein [Blastocatellia bacterium]